MERATTRSAALESIDENLDLGNDLTLAAYNAAIDATEGWLSKYNTTLSEVDGLLNQLEKSETKLDELSGRMLAGVGVKFGKDSDEYEKAGGTRTSERKSSKSKKGDAATTT
ncbi:MAG: hypothetical protein WDM76_11040 [Limisphaerales bacterium]